MAGTHNFQIFDEAMDPLTIDTDVEYAAEGQRINGVTPGLASPKMHNKLYRQCSVMAYAIASVLAARGFNASDGDSGALADAIQRAFAFKVNGNAPNAAGEITAVRPIDAWPVGSLFLTFDNTNPAILLGGGTWVQVKGCYLLAADTGDTVDGSTTVGAHTKNVPLPSHTHSFSIGSSGNHTHSVSNITSTAAGGHSHNRGSMNITGSLVNSSADGEYLTYADSITGSGALRVGRSGTSKAGVSAPYSGAAYNEISFDASRSGAWTGSTSAASDHTHKVSVSIGSSGAHTHSGTTASTGTSASFDVRPLSIYVYMWRRMPDV